LLPALSGLVQVIEHKAGQVHHHVKTGRIHLMDAMPVRLSQVLNGWAQQLKANFGHLQALEALRREAGPDAFNARMEHLNRLKLEFDDLANREKKDLQTMHSHAEKRQRVRYLEQFFIDKANLPGIGPANRATLASFGIETAAEVEWGRIRRRKGFGDVKTRTLVDWCKGLERNFRFNAAQSVTQADVNQVKQKIHARAQAIQQELRAGLSEVQQFTTKQEQTIRRHTPTLQHAANSLAQANADWEALH